MTHVKTEEQPVYKHTVSPDRADETGDDYHIRIALNILIKRQRVVGFMVGAPEDTHNFLKLKLSEKEHEVFAVLFLDTRHRLIKYVEMFKGTIGQSAVYPREVAKEALKHNAAAVILAHNHPSGSPEPSAADERITLRLREALAYFDVTVIDHMIVGQSEIVSLANRGVL